MHKPLLSLAVGSLLTLALDAPAFARRAPPQPVAPVVYQGVRYEAPTFAQCGQNGGCVVAYDDAGGARLWLLRVYCTHYDTSKETDVQDIFITSLVVEGGQLVVTNEKGQHFSIDPSTRSVTGDDRGCGGSEGCTVSHSNSSPAHGASLAAVLMIFVAFGRWFVSSSRRASPS